MANNLTNNPMVLDTTGVLIAAGVPVQISAIKAVGLTTAGHTAVVQDANGNPIWEEIAATTNYASVREDLSDLPISKRTYNGLKLATLGSGKVYVWVG